MLRAIGAEELSRHLFALSIVSSERLFNGNFEAQVEFRSSKFEVCKTQGYKT